MDWSTFLPALSIFTIGTALGFGLAQMRQVRRAKREGTHSAFAEKHD